MIGRLRGTVIEKQPPLLLLDVGGVGYEVQAPMTTFYQLPDGPQDEVVLHTHMVVREDAQQLFGFFEQKERALFRTLIKVNGVGPKMALTILSGMESSDFAYSVKSGDAAALVKLPGVGKKTAERLIVEMRDRLADWEVELPAATPATTGTAQVSASLLVQDAESVLVALGYKPQEASRAVSVVWDDGINNSEELIRLALKNMVS